ncbi:MAG: fumarylacetoacetate hydrolase family protein [Deltaproteobacteria bacterium]|nr:fumarylacetoacetate hydrolase family protein [Deltaproteobacteria bacterium]MBW2535319.1 fumarylacetoacetate hydrolase family protein [Deltaproteobacteria bacterium]
MKLARVRIESMATPVLAFVADGAVYDVAALEASLDLPTWSAADFHTRVISVGGAGLPELYERLRAGHRPTEARLPPGEYLPLAPCDTDRAAYVQLAPYDAGAGEPQFVHRTVRSAVGDEQPVALPSAAAPPCFEAGLAVVLSDDLWRATPREAHKAILGYTLALDWRSWRDDPAWHARRPWLDAPLQLGPTLLTADELESVDRLAARVRVGDHEWSAGTVGDWRFPPAESLAFVSQHLELQAGDVVGLGRLLMGSAQRVGRALGFHERVTLSVERLGRLTGWAVPGPEARWRQRQPA